MRFERWGQYCLLYIFSHGNVLILKRFAMMFFDLVFMITQSHMMRNIQYVLLGFFSYEKFPRFRVTWRKPCMSVSVQITILMFIYSIVLDLFLGIYPQVNTNIWYNWCLGTGTLPDCTKPLQDPKLSKYYKNKSPHLGAMSYNKWK